MHQIQITVAFFQCVQVKFHRKTLRLWVYTLHPKQRQTAAGHQGWSYSNYTFFLFMEKIDIYRCAIRGLSHWKPRSGS